MSGLVTWWSCHACEVQGMDPVGEEPRCWNCGGRVIVLVWTMQLGPPDVTRDQPMDVGWYKPPGSRMARPPQEAS